MLEVCRLVCLKMQKRGIKKECVYMILISPFILSGSGLFLSCVYEYYGVFYIMFKISVLGTFWDNIFLNIYHFPSLVLKRAPSYQELVFFIYYLFRHIVHHGMDYYYYYLLVFFVSLVIQCTFLFLFLLFYLSRN